MRLGVVVCVCVVRVRQSDGWLGEQQEIQRSASRAKSELAPRGKPNTRLPRSRFSPHFPMQSSKLQDQGRIASDTGICKVSKRDWVQRMSWRPTSWGWMAAL